MSYLVLARKYRPGAFDGVVGQEHVSKTLINGIKSGHIGHAYLFSGPRGVGKTTVARILAKTLNCKADQDKRPCNTCSECTEINAGKTIDIIEIDGASNRGIDEIRDLRENVHFAPAHLAYKIYIIDEVHMLTEQAFNALLKTLEEPPGHVVFIFATTELHKIPETILSRCQKFGFRLISIDRIVHHLEEILRKESVDYEQEALVTVAKASQGSIRDALSLLDQILAYAPKKITADDATFILGVMNDEVLFSIIDNVIAQASNELVDILEKLLTQGYDIHQIAKDIREHYRMLMLFKIDSNVNESMQIVPESVARYKAQAAKLTLGKITRDITVLSDAVESMKWSDYPRIVFELCMVKLSKPYISPDELVARIENMSGNIDQVIVSPPDTKGSVRKREVKEEAKVSKEKHAVSGKDRVYQSSSISMTDDDIRLGWKKMIELAIEEKIYLDSYFSEQQDIEMVGNKLVIYFANSFHLTGVMKSKNVVEKAAKTVFGESTYVACELKKNSSVLKQEMPSFQEGENKSSENESVSEDDEQRIVKAEPIVKHVLDMFEGDIVSK